ncbi:MAG TPA: hypothetical protein VGC41_28835 [Kofleriaceae bacterium]
MTVTLGDRTVQITDQFVHLVEAKKQESLRIQGRLFVARDVPREDLGIWLELRDKQPGIRRIFGVEPISLMDPAGLAALQRLDALAARLRSAVAEFSGDVRRALEIGRGLDKVLFVDHGDHHAVYARKLFRDRARLALSIYEGGRIAIIEGPEIIMTSQFGITVSGDYIRFIDKHGTDVARISIPWITREDREELARRIGQLIE